MTYQSQAAQYQEMEVMTASPEQLVVILFDHLLVTLRRAQMATDAKNHAMRNKQVEKARLIISELLAVLNYEAGGDIASQLAALYTYSLGELVAPSTPQLQNVSRIVTDLRDGFAEAAGVSAAA
jgi:flagellar protein FliS